jgi:hypothetical protein
LKRSGKLIFKPKSGANEKTLLAIPEKLKSGFNRAARGLFLPVTVSIHKF